jgi:hypothetical protein
MLSLPKAANPNAGEAKLFFTTLTEKVNKLPNFQKRKLKIAKILAYDSKKQEDDTKFEKLGIATIIVSRQRRKKYKICDVVFIFHRKNRIFALCKMV